MVQKARQTCNKCNIYDESSTEPGFTKRVQVTIFHSTPSPTPHWVRQISPRSARSVWAWAAPAAWARCGLNPAFPMGSEAARFQSLS